MSTTHISTEPPVSLEQAQAERIELVEAIEKVTDTIRSRSRERGPAWTYRANEFRARALARLRRVKAWIKDEHIRRDSERRANAADEADADIHAMRTMRTYIARLSRDGVVAVPEHVQHSMDTARDIIAAHDEECAE